MTSSDNSRQRLRLAGVAFLLAGLLAPSPAALADTEPARTVSWGTNFTGQLGYGCGGGSGTPCSSSPRLWGAVSELGDVVDVDAGDDTSLAVTADGRAWAWGWNQYGQLGDGTHIDRYTPVPVPGLDGVIAVAAGSFHSLALKSDGTVWAWGMGVGGQLGDGTAVDRLTPVRVSGLNHIVAIAAGRYSSYAIGDEGTLWAWGGNEQGQLGNGTTARSITPAVVPGMDHVVSVDAYEHVVAARDDGTVWAWGENWFGQIGDGTAGIFGGVDRLTPAQVPDLTGITSVGAGDTHSIALGSDGHAWTWGSNNDGVLGIGEPPGWVYVTPNAVVDLDNLIAVSAGSFHNLALRDDGTVWAWGQNTYGQLGDGTTVGIRVSRVPVVGLAEAHAVSAGGGHSLATSTADIRLPGAPVQVSAEAGEASAQVTWSAPADGGSHPVTRYRVTSVPAGFAVTLPADALSVHATGLQSGQGYRFEVRAINQVGVGPATSSGPVLPVGPPDAVAWVEATRGDQMAMVSWAAAKDNGAAVEIYEVEVFPYTNTSVPVRVIDVPGTETSVPVGGLINGRQYQFRVMAWNRWGEGPESALSDIAIPAGLPGPPGKVTAWASDARSATVEWKWTRARENGAQVLRFQVNDINSGAKIVVPGYLRTATLSGLRPRVRHRFRVRAINEVGIGAPTTSNVVIPPGR